MSLHDLVHTEALHDYYDEREPTSHYQPGPDETSSTPLPWSLEDRMCRLAARLGRGVTIADLVAYEQQNDDLEQVAA